MNQTSAPSQVDTNIYSPTYGTNAYKPNILPTQTTPTVNANSQTTASNPVSVVTSKTATKDLNNIQNNLNETKQGITNQASKVAADKAATDAKVQADKVAADAKTASDQKATQDKAVADAKIAADKAKVSALSGDTDTTTPSPTGTTNTTNTGTTTDTTAPPPVDYTKITPDQLNTQFGGNTTGLIQNPDGSYSLSYQNYTQRQQQGLPTPQLSPQDEANLRSADAVQKATDTYNQILNIQNGSIPLTAGEQAQVDATKESFQTLINQQQLANQTYQNGLNVLGNSVGRERFTPEIQMGEIQGAVSSGLAKIADLNGQMSLAVAKLEDGFKTNDIAAIKAANDVYQSAASARVAELQKTADYIQKQSEDAQKAIVDQQNYQMDVQKFQEQVKNDAFNQDLQTKTYNEKVATDKFDQAYKMEDLAIKRAASNLGLDANGNIISPQVNTNANGAPDSSQQQAFLSKLPPATATMVQQLANYQADPKNISIRGNARQQLLSLVHQYDPTYDEGQYATRHATITQFTSGKYSQQINSLNTAVGHISDILQNTQQLHNAGFTPYNAAKNTVESLFGAGGVTKASTNISAATGELAKAFTGVGATVEEIKNLGVINSNSSPEQVKGYISSATQLLASKLQALNDTYSAGVGKPPSTPFLSTTSQAALLALKKQGVDIKVPELDNSPIVKIQTFHDSSPSNAAIYDQIVSQFPSATPDQISQALNLQ